MRPRISPALRTAPLRACPTTASFSTATSARTIAIHTTISTPTTSSRIRPQTGKSRRRHAQFSCPFSQQHSLRSQSTSTPTSHPTSIAGILEWAPAEAVPGVVVHGFVRSVRTMKNFTFVTLGDGSSLAALQAVVPASLVSGLSGEALPTNGSAVRLEGAWTPSPGSGQSHELYVSAVSVVGPSDAGTFPIQKKYQTAEFLRTMPHLRPRIPFNTTVLRFRSDVVASLNRFFAEREFVETHTPLITSSDCEGAGEVFTVSAGPSSKAEGDSEGGFFRSPKYLTVSSQLHLEALAQAVGNVWTLSPTFRAENNDTARHLSEFYMLEAEVSFVDRLDSVMDLVEDMVRHVAKDHKGSRAYNELITASKAKNSKQKGGKDASGEEAVDLEKRWSGILSSSRWPRITYAEALRILGEAPAGTFDYPPKWEIGLMTEHERYLARVVGGDEGTPVFVTHYPRDIKAFYMLPTAGAQNTPEDTVDCFDLLVPDFCEIAGGSMREHRLGELVAAMKSRGMPLGSGNEASAAAAADTASPNTTPATLDWYVDLRRWGCPPHGGFGLGFDRFLCYLTGVPTIRDSVAFPRWYGRCDC